MGSQKKKKIKKKKKKGIKKEKKEFCLGILIKTVLFVYPPYE